MFSILCVCVCVCSIFKRLSTSRYLSLVAQVKVNFKFISLKFSSIDLPNLRGSTIHPATEREGSSYRKDYEQILFDFN